MWTSIEANVMHGMTTFEITENVGHHVFTLTAYGLYAVGLSYLVLLSKENRNISSLVLVLISPSAIVLANLLPYMEGVESITHGATATALGAPLSFVIAAFAVQQSLLDVRP